MSCIKEESKYKHLIRIRRVRLNTLGICDLSVSVSSRGATWPGVIFLCPCFWIIWNHLMNKKITYQNYNQNEKNYGAKWGYSKYLKNYLFVYIDDTFKVTLSIFHAPIKPCFHGLLIQFSSQIFTNHTIARSFHVASNAWLWNIAQMGGNLFIRCLKKRYKWSTKKDFIRKTMSSRSAQHSSSSYRNTW